jgi:aminoglycoside phosphotransferase (APT) family kinase protein
LLPEEIVDFLRRKGLVATDEIPAALALSGGVSSDIWRVDLAQGPLCVKRALPRLRVTQLWEAPVERNRYEYEWFRVAAAAVPQAVPRLGERGDGFFLMEYLAPERHPVWKSELRQGRASAAFAAQVGERLGRIHAATAGRAEVEQSFRSDRIFHAIRLAPYLAATALKHPDLAAQLHALVERTARTKRALVHGDVSPKNILCGPHGPVFLDAECAWFGDPAFDLAFCLNHLLLKCLWAPQATPSLMASFDSLADSYREKIDWESPEALESRTASLLPGLLLARIDGKSPVEYVTEEAQKERVRSVARPLIADPPAKLSAVRDAWQRSLK